MCFTHKEKAYDLLVDTVDVRVGVFKCALCKARYMMSSSLCLL